MTFEKVCKIVASQFEKKPSDLKLETRLVEDLGADSANVMVLILDMETEFGLEVEDDKILQLKTIGDIVNYIDTHK